MIQSRNIKKLPHIAILMCTYNGEQYLKEQLDSIESQDYKNWTLYVNDDSSNDKTLNILKSYQKKWGKKNLIIRRGHRKGFCQNFLQIINDPKIKAHLYLLCDQDDIWMPHKISHTLKKTSKLNPLKPYLYCARTTYVSRDAKKILGHSDLFSRRPSLKNALIQSLAGGNTMAFNNHLKRIVQRYPKVDVVSHDWWLYILNELMSGKTFYDGESTIYYRQHNKSLVGANNGIIAKLRRLSMLLKGVYRAYNSKHLDVFSKINPSSSRAKIELINKFFIQRDKGMLERLRMISGLGLYCQSTERQFAIYLGAILHKL